MRIKPRSILAGVFISAFVAIVLLFVFRESLLVRAANFMAPKADGAADVIVLEGEESPETGAVHTAANLLFSKQASRMVVVLHQRSVSKRGFALDESYPDLITKRLKALGLTEKQFMVMVTPVHHPITLTEAAMVLEALSKADVTSVRLLSKGFHTRRSFLIYRHVGRRHGISVIPFACFNDYRPEDWWLHEEGVREFAFELFKLLYYQIMGYIPMRFDY